MDNLITLNRDNFIKYAEEHGLKFDNVQEYVDFIKKIKPELELKLSYETSKLINDYQYKKLKNQLSMQAFSIHILKLDTLNHKYNTINNMDLHAIMYLGLAYAKKNKILNKEQLKRLYNEPFVLKKYGPRIQSIDNEYRIYGCDPIITTSEDNLALNAELNPLNEYLTKIINNELGKNISKTLDNKFYKQHVDNCNSKIYHYSLKNI